METKSKFMSLTDQFFPPLEREGLSHRSFNNMNRILAEVFPSRLVRRYWRSIKFTPSVKHIALIICENDRMDICRKVELMQALRYFADEDTRGKIDQYLRNLQDEFKEFQKTYDNAVFDLQGRVKWKDGTWGEFISIGLFSDFLTLYNAAVKLREYTKNQYRITKRLVLVDKDFENLEEDAQVMESVGEMDFREDGYLESFENGNTDSINFSHAITIGSFPFGRKEPFEDENYISLPFPYHKGDIVKDISDNTYGVLLTAPEADQSFRDYEAKADNFRTDFFTRYCSIYCLTDKGTIFRRSCHGFNLEHVFLDNSPRSQCLKEIRKVVLGKIDLRSLSYQLGRYLKSDKRRQ